MSRESMMKRLGLTEKDFEKNDNTADRISVLEDAFADLCNDVYADAESEEE